VDRVAEPVESDREDVQPVLGHGAATQGIENFESLLGAEYHDGVFNSNCVRSSPMLSVTVSDARSNPITS
jgi:hypothetical protein